MYTELRRYTNKEFCVAVKCKELLHGGTDKDDLHCNSKNNGCIKTAKEFHKWLNENGFHLLKLTGNDK